MNLKMKSISIKKIICLVSLFSMLLFTGCELDLTSTKKEKDESSSSFLDILTVSSSSSYSDKIISIYNSDNKLLYEVKGNLSYSIEENRIEIKITEEDGTITKQIIGLGSSMYYTILPEAQE